MEKRSVTVPSAADGARLDAFLAGALPDLSRNRLKNLILGGHVAIGRATIVEPRRPVKPDDEIVVTVPAPMPATPAPQDLPLSIVHEDDTLIVVDKPASMVVHPGGGNPDGTLVNALIAHCGDSLSGIGGVARPGIVHRLDKDTTGLLVAAKTDRAHQALSAQFADHGRTGGLERGYQAIVWGAPERSRGKVDAPLGRARHNREKIEIRADGRHAVTHYRIEDVYGRDGEEPLAARLACRLETGRTHQIRVHLASIGHPLIGDRAYGAGFATKANRLPDQVAATVTTFPRHALHAWLLGFTHPDSGEHMRFESPFPEDFQRLIAALHDL